MKWNDTLNLITPPETTINENGFPEQIGPEIVRVVFANKKSVSLSEFYKAEQTGYSVESKFEIYTEEYNGEKIVEHNSKRFNVLRTYENGDITELTLSSLKNEVQNG